MLLGWIVWTCAEVGAIVGLINTLKEWKEYKDENRTN